MATVDVIVPSYKSPDPDTKASINQMIRASECQCRDYRTKMPLHAPWDCDKGKHSVFIRDHVSSCVIHWSRNKSISDFLYNPGPKGRPPAEYALLCDDDMVALPQFLNRLLSHKQDIVAGICTRRRDPPIPTIKMFHESDQNFHEVVEWDFDSQKLMEVDASGTAFMLVRRTVFERMSEAYLDCEFERESDRKRALGAIDGYWDEQSKKRRELLAGFLDKGEWEKASCWWFQFLFDPFGLERGEVGEDISFCYKAKKLGFRIYADPQVCPGHIGRYFFNVKDYIQFVEDTRANNPQLPAHFAPTEPQLGPDEKLVSNAIAGMGD